MRHFFFSPGAFLCVASVLFAASAARLTVAGAESRPLAPPLYANDFEKVPEGDPPGDLVVLGGAFTIKKVDGNTLLELPGDPVQGYGVLFGPDSETFLGVSARIRGTATGKRAPEFGVGLADTNGYKLWVMPSTGELQILKGEDVKATVPYAWTSGAWTVLRLQVRKVGEGTFSVDGKAWEQGKPEPKAWMVSFAETEEPPKGRPSAWGSPYASTPIQFDDLVVTHAEE
jgi:hypothetical protein